MHLIWFALVGLVAGFLAGKIMKGSGYGIVGDIVIGVIGAFVGGYLFRAFGVAVGGGTLTAIAVATIGAVVLIFLLRLVKKL
jgi:uncharacterized membrane protein YeaQ/YmgE (transglycosylase-associated protein family)